MDDQHANRPARPLRSATTAILVGTVLFPPQRLVGQISPAAVPMDPADHATALKRRCDGHERRRDAFWGALTWQAPPSGA